MPLIAGCSRCSLPLVDEHGCAEHPDVPVLWHSGRSDYDSFAELLASAPNGPVYLPWPLGSDWTINGYGYVLDEGRQIASVTSTEGHSDMDGTVEVTVVSEEPGVGLGARCAGMSETEPVIRFQAADVKVRADHRPVPLWSLPPEDDQPLATAVFAGEAHGRWLWMILRPASAALLLRDDWLLRDATGFGPEAVELRFGGAPPRW